MIDEATAFNTLVCTRSNTEAEFPLRLRIIHRISDGGTGARAIDLVHAGPR